MDEPKNLGEKQFIPLYDELKNVFKRIEERAQLDAGIVGLSTPFASLDVRLKGLQAGHLIVLACDEHSSPNAFARSIALYAGSTLAVLYCVKEGSTTSTAEDMLCAESEILLDSVYDGGFHEREWLHLTDSVSSLKKKRIALLDLPEMPPSRFIEAIHGFASISAPPQINEEEPRPEMPQALLVVEDAAEILSEKDLTSGLAELKKALIETGTTLLLVLTDQPKPSRTADGTLDTPNKASKPFLDAADVVLYLPAGEQVVGDLADYIREAPAEAARLQILRATNGNRGTVSVIHEPFYRRYVASSTQFFRRRRGF